MIMADMQDNQGDTVSFDQSQTAPVSAKSQSLQKSSKASQVCDLYYAASCYMFTKQNCSSKCVWLPLWKLFWCPYFQSDFFKY